MWRFWAGLVRVLCGRRLVCVSGRWETKGAKRFPIYPREQLRQVLAAGGRAGEVGE